MKDSKIFSNPLQKMGKKSKNLFFLKSQKTEALRAFVYKAFRASVFLFEKFCQTFFFEEKVFQISKNKKKNSSRKRVEKVF